MAFVSTFGARIWLYVTGREAGFRTSETDSFPAVRDRILQHFLVKFHTGLAFITSIAAPRRGSNTAFDALLGIRGKGPHIFVVLASLADVTLQAAWKIVPGLVACMMHLASWEHTALQVLTTNSAPL